MQVLEFLETIRLRLADFNTDFLRWNDESIISWLNEAEVEACRRSRLLKDSSTAAVCQITAGTNSYEYALDPRVINVERAKFALATSDLSKRQYKQIVLKNRNWENVTPGTPKFYFTDYQSGKLHVYPKEAAADTLHMTVIREPLAPMVESDDAPEINVRYHYSLIEWVIYRALQSGQPNSDEQLAAVTALAAFEREFGERNSALQETSDARNVKYVNRYAPEAVR